MDHNMDQYVYGEHLGDCASYLSCEVVLPTTF